MKTWKIILFSTMLLATPLTAAVAQLQQEQDELGEHDQAFSDLLLLGGSAMSDGSVPPIPAADDMQEDGNEQLPEEASGYCEVTTVCFESTEAFGAFSSQVIAVESSCARYHYCPLRLYQTLEPASQGPGCWLAYLGISMEEFDAIVQGQGESPTEPALDREPFVIQERIDCIRGQVTSAPEEESTSSSGEDYAMESSSSSSSSAYTTSSSYDAWYSSSSSSYEEYVVESGASSSSSGEEYYEYSTSSSYEEYF